MAKQIQASELYQENVFENLRKSASDTLKVLADLDVTIRGNATSLKELLTSVNTTTQSGLNTLFAVSEKLNNQTKQTIQLEKQKSLSQKQMQSAEQSLQRQRERSIAAQDRANKKAAEAARPYKQLEQQLVAAKRAYQDLAAAGLAETKEAQTQLKTVNELRLKYEGLNKAIGNNQFAVGRYTDATKPLQQGLSKVSNLAAQFGLALGGVAIARNAIQTITDFDNSIQDLSAITGASGKQLDFFKTQSIELGKTVKGGASAVVEAYKLIASAKPELLENAEALNEVTKATITLAKASGMELPDAATALTDAMNQFGVASDQAGKFVDVLAAGAKYGAAEVPQITEALLKFGAVANTSNVNIQESTALIEDLAEKGLKGADAGTALRNVMLKLSAPDALPREAQDRLKQLGINFTVLNDKTIPFSKRLAELKPLLHDNAALVKTFGTENAVAATTLISTTDRIADLTKKVDENGVANEQAGARSKTLSQAYTTLKETFNSYVLELYNGAGATQGITSFLDYLSRNLPTIISLVGKLVQAFIVYKTTMAVLRLKDRITEFKNLGDSVNDASGKLTEGQMSAKAFGQALKGIGIAVAIDLVLELAQAFYDVASGASSARKEAAYLQAQLDRAKDDSDKNISEFSKTTDNTIANLERERKERLALAKTQADQAKVNADIDARKKIAYESENSLIKVNIDREKKKIAVNQADYKQTLDFYKAYVAFSDNKGGKAFTDPVGFQNDAKTLEKLGNKLGVDKGSFVNYRDYIESVSLAVGANIQASEQEIKAYKERSESLDGLIADENTELKISDINFKQSVRKTKGVKENTTTLKANNDELARRLKLQEDERQILHEIDQIRQEASVDPIVSDQQNELLKQMEKASRNPVEVNTDYLDSLVEAEFEVRKNAARKNAEFEKETLQLSLNSQYALRLEDLERERDALLAQDKLTDDERTKILASYEQRVREANAQLTQDEGSLSTKRLLIDTKLNQELEKLDKERGDKVIELNGQVIDAQITGAQKISEQESAANKKSQDDAVKYFRLRLLRSKKTDEEIEAELLQNRIDTLKKEIDLEQKAGHDTLDLETELAEKLRQKKDEEAAKDKKRKDDLHAFEKKLADEALDAAIQASQKREELIDKQIDASQKLADNLREQANAGNASAQQSLAVQDDITNQKLKQKAQEEKEQQQLQEFKLILEATNQYVQKGDSLPIAASKAFAEIGIANTIFNKIKGFYNGTKGRLGDENKAIRPGKDGHLIFADGNEMILNPQKTNNLIAAGINTTDEVTDNAIAFKRLTSGEIAPNALFRQSKNDNKEVVKMLGEVKRAIKEIPGTEISAEFENGVANAVLFTRYTQAKTIRTRHERK